MMTAIFLAGMACGAYVLYLGNLARPASSPELTRPRGREGRDDDYLIRGYYSWWKC